MNVDRSKRSVACRLRRLANRLDPAPPLIYETDVCMTGAVAKVIADMVSGQLGSQIGSQIGITFPRPDGTRGRV